VLVVLIYSFPEVLPGSLYYYLFLAANIPAVLNISLPFLTHYWSLGVEEQFYLFWPWLIKYFSPIKAVSFFLVFFFCLKGAVRYFLPASGLYQFIHVTRFDCMAIGALWSILLTNKKRLFLLISFNRITQAISWIILVLAASKLFRIPDFINQEVFSVASAIIILNVAFNEKSLINLENKIFNFLGKISYGIYVYHVLVIYILGKLLQSNLYIINAVIRLPIIIIIVLCSTILIAWISYTYFEKPFLKFKNRFSKIHSHS
jgi:peptidoglycan/LPS O-acetylase OafA/YrhL